MVREESIGAGGGAGDDVDEGPGGGSREVRNTLDNADPSVVSCDPLCCKASKDLSIA